MQPEGTPTAKPIRCAIYTRKSTDDGLEQDFNSLDAQRECAEAYILSQRHERWIALPRSYDDGGFTGANIERPALRQLLADVAAGLVDCVVVYKVDRLSRSLLDFARIMEVFDKGNVSFVSVTQQLNTTSPMGRLTLNVLLSFAQFEREIISERTRDKMIAARRKGKWTGGYPALGYDADPATRKLVVNEIEAARVREIFGVFLKTRSLAATLAEIERRGWTTKAWITRKSRQRVGAHFDRPALIRVLTNVLYIGEVGHGGARYPGEQEPILERKVWDRAHQVLEERRRGGSRERVEQSPVLQRRLLCAICGKAMTHGYTTKRSRRYRYYLCQASRKGGAEACRGQIITANRIERAVTARLVELGSQPGWEKLTEALRLHPAEWPSLSTDHQHPVLEELVSEVRYDHRAEQAWMLLKPAVQGDQETKIVLQLRKHSSSRRDPALPRFETSTPVPKTTLMVALAFRFEKMLTEGAARNYPDVARQARVSTSRVSQILKLRNLAPQIQERLLLGSVNLYIPEAELRGISEELDWNLQQDMFERLLASRSPSLR